MRTMHWKHASEDVCISFQAQSLYEEKATRKTTNPVEDGTTEDDSFDMTFIG